MKRSPTSEGKITRLSPRKNRPFYRDVAQILSEYYDPEFILQPWVNTKKLNPYTLLENPRAFDLIKKINFQHHYQDQFYEQLLLNPNPKILLELIPNLIPRLIKIGRGYNLKFTARSNDPDVIERIISSISERDQGAIKSLSANPVAIQWIKENPNLVNWEGLSKNPHPLALELLLKNPKKIDWSALSKNPSDFAMDLLEKYPKKIDWDNLSANPSALNILEKNLDKITVKIASNPNIRAVPLIEKLLHELKLSNNGSRNELEKYQTFWYNLSANPNGLDILARYPDKIDIEQMSKNPKAFPFMLKYPSKINWTLFSRNPGIFQSGKPRIEVTKFFEELVL